MGTRSLKEQIMAEFSQVVAARNNGVIYLDSAATSQSALQSLRATHNWQDSMHGNVHRGLYAMSEDTTAAYEGARKAIQNFIGAMHAHEIIYTKNCTEALNMCIQGWSNQFLTAADTVALCKSSHHSAIIPWRIMQKRIGFTLTWVELTNEGQFDTDQFTKMCKNSSVKAVCVPGINNVIGTHAPLEAIIQTAKQHGVTTFIDAAQMITHEHINVQSIECDFLTFSGHKLYGPTGIGVLYGKQDVLNAIEPMQGGGMMVSEVSESDFTYAPLPYKFEAGTPPIAQAIALGSVCNWLSSLERTLVFENEQNLLQQLQAGLQGMPDIQVIYDNAQHVGCISFSSPKIHAHDLADILGAEGIAVRAGQHCAQPLHQTLGLPATVRVSVAMYNTPTDIERLLTVLQTIFTKL